MKWNMTKEYKLWTGINVWVTNVPITTLDAKSIFEAYRLRWQVELIFKSWKSHYKIHSFKKMKKERFECYLYASLLLIILQTNIFSWLQNLFENIHKLSLLKFTKVMTCFRPIVKQVVMGQTKKIKKLLILLFE